MGESALNPREKARVAKEAAVNAWENNPERNAENLKVVRGSDGLPVEVITKSQQTSAFVVNGQEREFNTKRMLDGNWNAPIPQLCLDGILKQAYEVKAITRLTFDDDKKVMYVLSGTAVDLPAGLVVRRDADFS